MNGRSPGGRAAGTLVLVGALLLVGLAVAGGTAAAQNADSAPDCNNIGFDGSGTSDDPYQVTNVSQLQCVGNSSSDVQLDKSYELTSDIAASNTSKWNDGAGFRPIGNNDDNDFSGRFNGTGKNITGLMIDRSSEDRTGLFDTVENSGTVENVGVVQANVTGRNRVGGIAGRNDGTVTDASASGDIDGRDGVGGLIGYHQGGTVERASATGTVSGRYFIGGLIGDAVGGPTTVRRTSATGDVTGNEYVGGLMGANGDELTPGGRIESSRAEGTVTASGEDPGELGGLVGSSYGAVINNSTATGNVNAPGADDVGGLAGYTGAFQPQPGTSEVNYSAATGDVEGNKNVGGLVGRTRNDTVNRSYAEGDVTGSQRVGGLVGFNNGTDTQTQQVQPLTVLQSYATGSVSGGDEVGGLIGRNLNDTVKDTYAVGDVSGGDQAGCLVGNNTGADSQINRSYAACEVTGDSSVGGLVGNSESGASVDNSYWDQAVAGRIGSDGGVPLRSAAMTGSRAPDNMDGFDFENTWSVDGGTYPYLQNNSQTPPPEPPEGDDDPEITNYDVTVDGEDLVISFDSSETLVEITVEITGEEDATLDESDFSGGRAAGYEGTYSTGDDGSYTVELTEARDSSNNDGVGQEEFSESVSVDTGRNDTNATATPTPTSTVTDGNATDTATPTPTPTDGDETTAATSPTEATATPTDEPSGPTDSPTGEDQPGFGVVLAVVAVLAAALVARRRDDDR
jgi:PGF-CTERM protein